MKVARRNALRTALLAVVTALLATVGLAALASAWMAWSARDATFTVDDAPPHDVAVVLGAQVRSTGPSDMLEDRLRAAHALYRRGAVKRLLLSGDASRSYNEVKTMRRFLLEAGVPDDVIGVDPAGHRTLDSIFRARDLYQLRSFIVVTNDFHIPRALFLARACGVEAVGVSTNRPGYPAMVRARNVGREHLARVLALLDVYVLDTRPRVTDGPRDPFADDPAARESATKPLTTP